MKTPHSVYPSFSYTHEMFLHLSLEAAQNDFLCMPRKKLDVLRACSDPKKDNLNRLY